MSKHQYFVYILCSHQNGTLYVGVTNDIARRLEEHRDKMLHGFTSKYNVNRLVYIEEHQYIDQALQREKQIKTWKRAWKLRLIEEINPEWHDLREYIVLMQYDLQ